ncbi:MAG: hypothetical protein HQ580_12155 [Planctomycetes bacterium]|nr:hypothetical protein [Planctomycetota bacterium]
MISIRDQLRQGHSNIPNLYKGAFRKKWIKALQRKSMKAAVTAKCQDCMNWNNAEIGECSIVTCPLFQYRPFANKNGELETEVIVVVTEIETNNG